MSSATPAEGFALALKQVAGLLREGGVPFLLGGSMASWARGGPASTHDVDFFLKPEDADRARELLRDAGLRIVDPPEGWLFKAYVGDVLVDLIFGPSGLPVDDELLERAEVLPVMAVPMKVLSLEDLLTTKLACLREHELAYDEIVLIARSLRERIDWEQVRAQAPDNAYVRAFFTLVEELGIVPAPSGHAPQQASLGDSLDDSRGESRGDSRGDSRDGSRGGPAPVP